MLDYLIKERTELALILRRHCAEFRLEALHHNAIVDGKDKYAILKVKYILEQFKDLDCNWRINAVEVINKEEISLFLVRGIHQRLIDVISNLIFQFLDT